jgi:hypothetical protein
MRTTKNTKVLTTPMYVALRKGRPQWADGLHRTKTAALAAGGDDVTKVKVMLWKI